MEGDGIGPEVVAAAVQCLRAAAPPDRLTFVPLPVGLSAYEQHGSTLPEHTEQALQECDGWLLGPLTTHVYSGASQPNVSAVLRTRYNLFANIRPVRSYVASRSRGLTVDLVVVRENTQGFYADRNMQNGTPGEFVPADGVALAVRVITRDACRQIAQAGFDLARRRKAQGRPGRVTLVHKANVLRTTDGLFLETCREVAADYPEVTVNDLHVDAAAMKLALDPEQFDVIVTTNMFGDILSDEAAGLVGGLGLAPGLNAGTDRAMAQAVHGSAPDIAGRGISNPVAEILSGAMLLDWLASRTGDAALGRAARSLERAVEDVLAEGAAVTPDLAGRLSTAEFGRVIAARAAELAASAP